MADGDVPAVVEIERASFTLPWSPGTFRGLLGRRDADLWVAEEAGRVVGYAVVWFVLREAELANLAVDPAARGRGVGGRILDHVLGTLRARGVREVFLEVRASNRAAARLYEGRGFVEVARRPNYYDRPREDARVLRARLE